MSVVLGGSLAILVALMWDVSEFKPVPGAQVGAAGKPGGFAAGVVFGFLFVTVVVANCRADWELGEPGFSGMTIATLMATSAIFLVKDGRLRRLARWPSRLAAWSALLLQRTRGTLRKT
jgi:hypothetical protein